MDAIGTPRLRVVPLSLDHAEAILDGRRPDGANWADGYPTDSSLVAAGYAVTAAAEGHELGPWTVYQVIRRSDDRVLAGMGFFGPPAGGAVHVGFSESDEARADGATPEALSALIAFARRQAGVERVCADTAVTNRRVAEVLEGAGMRRTGSDGELVFYEA